jgi:hypothetical protein
MAETKWVKCAYRHCDLTFPERPGKRFHSRRCQDAYHYDQKRGLKTTRKKRLVADSTVPATPLPEAVEKGHFSSTKTVACKGHVSYYFVEARTVPPKHKGMMPPGPPPPLSDVEIAVLGGYVVTVKPRPYVSKPHTENSEGESFVGPTPGAIQGDFLLEYYDDGYPMIPECLDRRRVKLARAA